MFVFWFYVKPISSRGLHLWKFELTSSIKFFKSFFVNSSKHRVYIVMKVKLMLTNLNVCVLILRQTHIFTRGHLKFWMALIARFTPLKIWANLVNKSFLNPFSSTLQNTESISSWRINWCCLCGISKTTTALQKPEHTLSKDSIKLHHIKVLCRPLQHCQENSSVSMESGFRKTLLNIRVHIFNRLNPNTP